MLEIADENGLVRVRAGGTLDSSDYDHFAPLFERIAAREQGAVPMVIELAPDFSGWDLGGIWRDLKFDVRHKDSFGPIAIVGDSRWEEWGTRLSGPFFRSEMKFFGRADLDAAERWARDRGNAG
jgi:hypothetical protein